MFFFHASSIGFVLAISSSLAMAERLPGIYRVVKPQSIPIQWEGRVIGQLVLPAGKEIEVVKIAGGVYTCRNARQTFTLMEDCLEPVAAATASNAAVPGSVVSISPSPSGTTAGQEVVEVAATGSPSPPAPAAPVLPDWEPVEKYLAGMDAYLGATALNVRYFQYSKLSSGSGREVRSQVRKWKVPEGRDVRVRVAGTLDAAFTAYDRQSWTKFETELRNALEVWKSKPGE